MGNYTIFYMFQKPRRGRPARNFTKKVPKILDLKSSSEQIFSENWRWVPLTNHFQSSNKPNIGELNDFALFRYSRVLWSNGNGKAFVRQLGAFNSEGRLLQTVCGKSFNLRQEPGLYLYLKRGFYLIMYFIRCQCLHCQTHYWRFTFFWSVHKF